MNPQDGNIMQQARQTLQGAQSQGPVQAPQQPPMAPQDPTQGQGLPVPPPNVAMHLANFAQQMDPMILGTLLWRALKQHGETMNMQGLQDLGQGAQPGGVPPTAPPMGGQM